jgi:TRAP-type C4-dicarboxylate transport system substrate-binding protein
MIQNRLQFAARAATAVFAFAFVGLAGAQTKWDMPTAYPPSNYHTENIAQFAADVDQATGGKLKITVHNNASLFKANEIKRAVQSGQAQIGEILISNYSNEDPVYGLDSVPFLATSFSDAEKTMEGIAQDDRGTLREAGAHAALCSAVAAAGNLHQQARSTRLPT